MSKSLNRCAHCGGKFGLVSHSHLGQRFCRKACKEEFVARRARERDSLIKWLFLSEILPLRPRGDCRCCPKSENPAGGGRVFRRTVGVSGEMGQPSSLD